MGESSLKCCEVMERCAATNVRQKSAATAKTRTAAKVTNISLNGNNNNNNGCQSSAAASSIDVVGGRACTSPPYELDHMYANNCAAAGAAAAAAVSGASSSGDAACDANFARPSAKLLMASSTTSPLVSPSPSTSTTTSTATTDAQRQLLCMRELVFLHLDLIQQQQNQLDARDQQIAVLRQESDGLKEQLECTKARLASLAKENVRLKGDEFDDRQRNPPGVRFSHKSNGNRVRNHSSSCKESSNSKRSRYDTDVEVGSGTKKKSERKSSSASLQQQQQQKEEQQEQHKKDDHLQTDLTYFTCIGTTTTERSSSPVEDDTVLVPCWRLHPITSCYQMEGTENLDDDIFIKRHQKLEIDEKRRKRWDIQRIREQRMQEKLRKGRQTRDKNMRNNSPDLDTFYPMADDVQFIEVSDTLPVVTFGYSIPNFSTSEFQLPWLNSSDKSWSEIGRASRGSKRGT